MTFWSGDTLNAKLKADEIVRPFEEGLIDCAAYRLRMGREAYVTPDHRLGVIERSRKDNTKSKRIQRLSEHEHVVIPAGQFAWLLTEEYLKIPRNVVAFISLRTKLKFKGLINVSGFHVDPGFEGRLIYAVYNAGPQEVRIAQGADIFLIWFASLDNETNSYYKENYIQERINPEIIVSGEIVSLQSLQSEIDRLSAKVSLIRATAQIIIAILSLVLAFLAITQVWEFAASWINSHFG